MKKALYILFFSFTVFLLFSAEKRIKIERIDFQNPEGDSYWSILYGFAATENAIMSVKYLPDGERVLLSTDYGEIMLIEINTQKIIWEYTPYEGYDNAVYISDVDDTGTSFISYCGGSTDYAHAALNIHNVSNGKIVKSIEQDSLFYQKDYEMVIDHRKPANAEIAEREDMGLGPYWRVAPYNAEFVNNGKNILVTYANMMTGPNLYDRSFRLFNAKTGDRIWDFQVLADEANFDSAQPAGFQIGLPFPMIIPFGGTTNQYLYGTAHARIHIIDEKFIKDNMAKKNIMDKKFSPVFLNPVSENPDYSDMAMPIQDMTFSPDNKVLYFFAGSEGEGQIIAYDLKNKKYLFKSTELDNCRLTVSPDGSLLGAGTTAGTMARVVIIDPATGKLAYMGPRFGSFGSASLVWNPRAKELCIAQGNALFFLRERKVKKIKLTGNWQKTGVYIRIGTSLQIFGSGEISISTQAYKDDDERWSYDEQDDLFFGEGDGRLSLNGESEYEGEVYLKADPAGEWRMYGGLTRDEFNSVQAIRAGSLWNK